MLRRCTAAAAVAACTAADRPVQRVMVTGGSGYLGRNVIREFTAKGIVVHAIGRSAGAREAVAAAGAVPFPGDLSDEVALRDAAAGCDTVIHSAASVGDWARSVDEMRRVNVGGTASVMRAARAAGVSRVVHVGTEAACLTAEGAPLRGLTEETPLPSPPFAGAYSTTKNEAEREALSHNGDGLEVVVVRPRFIWGRDDTVLLAAFSDAARSGALRWFDGGEYRISTCHVANVVHGIERAATRGAPGEAYFLTDGEPVTFRPFISGMLRAAGVEPPAGAIPLRVVWAAAAAAEWVCGLTGLCEPFVSRQALALMAQEVTVSDAKARRELGYEPPVSVDAGLAELREMHAPKGAAPAGGEL